MRKTFGVTTILAVTFGLMTMGQPARANEEGGACREDAKKLCGDVKAGGGAIRDCLQKHEADLSPACKESRTKMKAKFEEKRKELEAACGADLKQYCANVTPGEGREFACLKAYEDKVSAGCKEKLPKHGMHNGMHHPDKDDGDHDKKQEHK